MRSEKLIEVRNITFTYPAEKKQVLKNVSFDLNKGFIYGVVGRNSVGKSTLLKILAGHLGGFEGNICMTGAADEVEYKAQVAAIISDEGFFENLSIGDNGILRGNFYETFDEKLFFEYLNRYQLNKEAWLEYLSAGGKMKFYLAFALACKPELLILDEPAGVLDGKAREEFMHLISYLATEEQITILMATHLTNDLDKLADYVLFVNEDGTTAMYDREVLNDKYVLLKGTKEQLDTLEHVVAMEVTETTATAMTNQFRQIKSQVEEIGLTKEIATLEDIMYYNHLGECYMQEEQEFDTIPEYRNKKAESRFGKIQSMYCKLTAMQGRRWNAIILFGVLFLWWSISYVNDNGASQLILFFEVICGSILVDVMATPKGISFEQLLKCLRQVPVSHGDYVKFQMYRKSIGRIVALIGLGMLVVVYGLLIHGAKNLKVAKVLADVLGIDTVYPVKAFIVLSFVTMFFGIMLLWMGHMVVIACKNRHR